MRNSVYLQPAERLGPTYNVVKARFASDIVGTLNINESGECFSPLMYTCTATVEDGIVVVVPCDDEEWW